MKGTHALEDKQYFFDQEGFASVPKLKEGIQTMKDELKAFQVRVPYHVPPPCLGRSLACVVARCTALTRRSVT